MLSNVDFSRTGGGEAEFARVVWLECSESPNFEFFISWNGTLNTIPVEEQVVDIGLLLEVLLFCRSLLAISSCFGVFALFPSSFVKNVGSKGDVLLCERARCLGEDLDDVKSTLCGFLMFILLFDLLFSVFEKSFSKDPLDDWFE